MKQKTTNKTRQQILNELDILTENVYKSFHDNDLIENETDKLDYRVFTKILHEKIDTLKYAILF